MLNVIFLNGIILLFLCINGGRSDTCICTEKSGLARCLSLALVDVDIRGNTQEARTTVETGKTKTLPKNVIPFRNTQQLMLQCDIRTLNRDSLANQNNLKVLDFSENFISNIPNDFFVNSPLINKLNLSHNTFQSPTLDTFYALNNVTILDISYNQITYLPLGMLDEMKKLLKLYINGNKISALDLGLFDKSKNLLVLDVSENDLSKLELGLFDRSKLLKEVNLGGNKFEDQVPLGTYDGFKNVVTLNISQSSIKKFLLGAFDETKKVERLDLSGNSIQMLPLGIFDRMKLLATLNLADCSFNDLPKGLFDQNSALQSLELSRNNLKTLPDGLFNSTQNLKYLNLSHNSINDLPIKIFQYTALVEIDISYNKLTTITPELLNMESLEKVQAQNNQISFLASNTFATVDFPLKYLDISNNRLVFLEYEYFFEWTQGLKRMEILGNPWNCKCLDGLLEALSKRSIAYSTATYFEGTRPVCVDIGRDKCDIKMDRSTIELHYNIFVNH